MVKIINGKKYSTETAECVGHYDNGWDVDDDGYHSEELYRKKTGEFFLFCSGTGEPATGYARPDDMFFFGNSIIIPLSFEDAQGWAELTLSGEQYVEIFGDVAE